MSTLNYPITLQDTIVALEALSEYALSLPETPITTINAQFTITGKSEMEKMNLEKSENKVEAELKVSCLNLKLTNKGRSVIAALMFVNLTRKASVVVYINCNKTACYMSYKLFP